MSSDDRSEARETEEAEEAPDERDDNPFEELDDDGGVANEWDDDAADEWDGDRSIDGSDPFAELDVGDGDEAFDDAFERMEVDDVSDEELWTALDQDSAVDAVPPADEPAGEEHVVQKREYCQRCPKFSAPPETACTHEDGTIVEVIETDEFRVRGCPMVSDAGPLFDTGP